MIKKAYGLDGAKGIQQISAMKPCVAFLRAINVGGNTRVCMEQLRQVAEHAGLTDVTTVLQTGNIRFHYDDMLPLETVEAQLETALATELNLKTHVIARSQDELASVVENNPYPEAARETPGKLLIIFLKGAASAEGLEQLKSAIRGPEQVALWGKRTLFALYPDGIGRSKLTTTLIEKELGCRCTGRNWNTLLKIHASSGPQ